MNLSRISTLVLLTGLGLVLTSTVASGCGSDADNGFPDPPGPDDASIDNSNGFGDGSLGDGKGCVNLECNRVSCPTTGATTSLHGVVRDPKGAHPLFNALVYIANAPVEPFDPNAPVTCEQCAKASGSPINQVLTGADGVFDLTNIPAGVDFTLVIQLGKWRRQVPIPAVTACTKRDLEKEPGFAAKTRLPSKKSDGDIPKMAIATGGADSFECLLRKIGIADEEFTVPSQNGRVHYYQSYLGRPLRDSKPAAPNGKTLWSDESKLKKYDMVLLPCEKTPDNKDKGENAQTADGYKNVEQYVDSGGRLFVTHYSYTWLNNPVNDPDLKFKAVANWQRNENDRNDKDGTIDKLLTHLDLTLAKGGEFPKGKAFADWLVNVGASPEGRGTLRVDEWRHDVASVTNLSQQWIHANTKDGWTDPKKATAAGAGPVTDHFTFNAPLDKAEDKKCGKVVYSDFHVTAGSVNAGSFPAECKDEPMSPQEAALEFMFFDLAACIQDEGEPPVPPIH